MEKQEIEGLEWKESENEDEGEHPNQDPFTNLMFGSGRSNSQPSLDHPSQIEPEHNQINYEELMLNIDNLMESVRGLRPLLQKVYPLIEQLWKKK